MFLEQTLANILGEKRIDDFTLYLYKENKTLNSFFKICATIFALIVIIILTLFSLNIINFYLLASIIICAFPITIILNYYYILFKEERRQKKIEKLLQDVLLQCSLFPKGTEITKILKYISEQNYTYISLEFKIALKQIKKGYSIPRALQEICKRNKSSLLERIINLMIIGYKSGKDMHFIFNKISQYILRIQELERERYSSLAIQKYTLLLSSAILVPMILGWIQNIITGFDFSSFQTIDIITQDPKLVEYAKYATWIYLAELSIISSFFIALIDGNKKKFVLYLLFILPIAFLIFWLV